MKKLGLLQKHPQVKKRVKGVEKMIHWESRSRTKALKFRCQTRIQNMSLPRKWHPVWTLSLSQSSVPPLLTLHFHPGPPNLEPPVNHPVKVPLCLPLKLQVNLAPRFPRSSSMSKDQLRKPLCPLPNVLNKYCISIFVF